MADNAYGFLEVKGLVTAVVAGDAMVKSAYVRLQAQIQTDPGLITLWWQAISAPAARPWKPDGWRRCAWAKFSATGSWDGPTLALTCFFRANT